MMIISSVKPTIVPNKNNILFTHPRDCHISAPINAITAMVIALAI